MKILKKHLIIFFTTGAYSGYAPMASGTAGSLVGILIYLIMPHQNSLAFLLITFIITALGIPASSEAEKFFSKKDPGEVVIDEIAGMLISLFYLPFSFKIVTVSFFLFRFLDITKPFRILEKLPGGWGIMLDDVAAAFATNIILQFWIRYV